jgi:hypothetical protein
VIYPTERRWKGEKSSWRKEAIRECPYFASVCLFNLIQHILWRSSLPTAWKHRDTFSLHESNAFHPDSQSTHCGRFCSFNQTPSPSTKNSSGPSANASCDTTSSHSNSTCTHGTATKPATCSGHTNTSYKLLRLISFPSSTLRLPLERAQHSRLPASGPLTRPALPQASPAPAAITPFIPSILPARLPLCLQTAQQLRYSDLLWLSRPDAKYHDHLRTVDIFGRVVISETITSGKIVDKARTADHFLRLREEEE